MGSAFVEGRQKGRKVTNLDINAAPKVVLNFRLNQSKQILIFSFLGNLSHSLLQTSWDTVSPFISVVSGDKNKEGITCAAY